MSDGLFDLSGRVALVTGTSRGLGQYMARALAKAGADLVITSRDITRLAGFEAEIKALGRRTFSAELDVRSKDSIEKTVAAAEAAFGHVDILVNNAGCNVRKPALDVTWDDWNLILETNLRGSFFCCASNRARDDRAALWTHHQHRLCHDGCRLCGARSIWSKPRRREAIDDESGR